MSAHIVFNRTIGGAEYALANDPMMLALVLGTVVMTIVAAGMIINEMTKGDM